MMEYEDIVPDWSHLSTGDLLRLRYENGVRLRCTYPRPAFPDYTYRSYIVAANRVLDGRLVVS